MAVWAISDLHLSFANPKRREHYAARWQDHAESIKNHWIDSIGPHDLVLIPGDISMAFNHRDLQPDLDWLGRLPGIKILAPGNHDRWWGRLKNVQTVLRRSQRAVDGIAIVEAGAVICGARSLDVIDLDQANPLQRQQYERIANAVHSMLAEASSLRAPGMPLYVLWHHPPFDQYGRPGPWVSFFEKAQVTACVYGHLHAELQWSFAVQGLVRGVRYACVSADAIGFRPLRIDRPTHDSKQPTQVRS
ncbi:metallophosphoesterase [Tautonia rosea]|uniref:metallophosphoesterase n=1 Tax=Tautonia rosea TaxID=2728037 RepID=UPI00147582DC|nr:metallophosphoesterase [Tautonia rosea]